MVSYLDLARSALVHREVSEQSPSATPSGQDEARVDGEKSEQSEKSPARDAAWITPDEAEQLKQQILAAVTVTPEDFDRAGYEALLARWTAYEAALVRPSHEEQIA